MSSEDLFAKVWHSGFWQWTWKIEVMNGAYVNTAMTKKGAIKAAKRQAELIRRRNDPWVVRV